MVSTRFKPSLTGSEVKNLTPSGMEDYNFLRTRARSNNIPIAFNAIGNVQIGGKDGPIKQLGGNTATVSAREVLDAKIEIKNRGS